MNRCQANATSKVTAETIRMHTQFPGDGGVVLGRVSVEHKFDPIADRVIAGLA